MKNKFINCFFLFLSILPVGAQAEESPFLDSFQANGFIDTYYSDDLDDQGSRTNEYLTQPKYRDEPRLNLANLSVAFDNSDFHSKLSVQYGDSVDVNYSAEETENVKYIQEAYVGYSLSEKLRVDAGIYLSHIGLENFNSYLNAAYTRAFVSEFSPYYQSGIRLSYEYSKSLSFQFHVLNGWQNISVYDGGIAFGTQVVWKSEDGYQFSYNTYLGTESDYTRFFNDFVLTIPLREDLNLYLVTDVGFQNNESADNASWTGNLMILEYKATDKLSLVGRAEHYQDRDGTIVTTRDGLPFSSFAYSAGVNYQLAKGLLLRTEIRRFDGTDQIFSKNSGEGSHANTFLTTALTYNF